ncbi:urease accessory protein UreD [Novosphingobium album (ex Liu et al. 2023)]|uniref:Urease accessory protein UreD n=1 Tax=Novosphingobium album (ex Liu et al. 2023) TaxID=3031130 RepID=A0ABT5WUL8_9SPHN|nr:urease accessory protein UreD [Novosphingobium album (ex Liu et al. 2023)]MDE8653595.1 urease accessory protein UreD [Novosphingobium album (ex Liu et al. 2023)]
MTALRALPLPDTSPEAKPRGAARMQRVDGQAMVRFGPHGVRDLRQVAPARLLFPDGRDGDFPLAVTVTTTGGLTGGDRLALDIVVDPGAAATIVPQAAEKLYRALPDDPPTRIETRVTIGAGGRCEWLAQEAILFDRSRMRRSLEIDLAADARILAMEMLVLGRGAMGETYREGLIHDTWRVRRDGRLVWVDALHVAGDVAATAAAPFGFGGASALVTLVHAGPAAPAHLDLARGLCASPGSGATAFDGLLILRMTGPDPRVVRDWALNAAGALRAAIFGISPRLPSLCYC